MTEHTDIFKDIRPFTDHEFPEVKKRLIANEFLIATVRMMIWPRAPEWLDGITALLIKAFLKIRLVNIHTVDQFQKKIIGLRLLKWVLDQSTDRLTWSGLEHLDHNKSYVFISNHRDIVLDSAIINYILNDAGHKVPYIAFGDNLLFNDMIEDLIRINKAFIVKRNLPPKQQLKELKHLSTYINLLLNGGDHIWIAQREGRSKDGKDQTNPAIIKMLHLAERKSQPDFAAYIKSIRIVPVAISYEKDPCDRLKARELYKTRLKGEYKKKRKDDLVSMATGISGDKGNIHVAFCPPLAGEYESDKEVAEAIDQAIHDAYKLWPRNYVAYDQLTDSTTCQQFYNDQEKEVFLANYRNLKPEIRKILFQIYANPIISKKSHRSEQS
jgi:1-acyl-sn-glycerol-3-phosphate acyltransferase